jgi:hypothetical protein
MLVAATPVVRLVVAVVVAVVVLAAVVAVAVPAADPIPAADHPLMRSKVRRACLIQTIRSPTVSTLAILTDRLIMAGTAR